MQPKRESVPDVQVGLGRPNKGDDSRSGASGGRPNSGPRLRRIAILGSTGSIVIALLGLLSYLPGLALLGSISGGYIPMAPSTAISFIMLGGIILATELRSLSGAILHLVESLAGLVTLFAALEVIGYFAGMDLNFEDMLVPTAGYIGDIPIARMSPSTAALFFLAGLAVLALLRRTRNDTKGSILTSSL